MAEWRTRKILVGSDRDWYPSAQTKSASEMVIDSNVRADPDWASEWICTIRGTTVLFAVVHDLHPHVRTLFGHLETPGAAPRTRIEIRRTQSGELALLKDGRERMRTIEPALAIGALHVVVLECIRPSVNWFALLHGAALARKGNGLALVGLSGSGKSTLAAGLLSAGFDYLADDLIALSSPDGAIVPWPLPLSVKPGSIEVLTPRYPELARASRYLTKGVEARLLIPPAEAWDLEPVKLSALLFPRFVDSSKPELQRLSAFQAIERLLKDRVWLGDPITEERVESFLKRLHHTPAYALSYGNLDDGIGLVEEVIT